MKQKYADYLIQKTREDYDKIAGDFDRTRSYIWEDLARFTGYALEGGRVLDFGCGNGRLMEIFNGKNIKYIGIDSSPALIEIAKRKYQKEIADGRAEFLVSDALELPFADAGFDAVYSIASFHHIPSVAKREELSGEFRRILKPNGKLIITVWNLWQKKYLNLILKYTFKKLISQSKMDFKDILVPWKNQKGDIISQRYYHAFTPRELRKIVFGAGFATVDKGFFGGAKNNLNIYLTAEKR